MDGFSLYRRGASRSLLVVDGVDENEEEDDERNSASLSYILVYNGDLWDESRKNARPCGRRWTGRQVERIENSERQRRAI